MNRAIYPLLLSSVVLASCGSVGQSRLNPFNWFGRGAPVVETETTERNALIPERSIFATRRGDTTYAGVAVPQVTALRVDRLPGGAVITATGVTQRLGAYDTRLVLESVQNGTQIYALKTLYNPGIRAVGTTNARTVTAGVRVSDQDLAGVRSIRVISAGNALESRR